ncbi:MAG: uridine kinase [Gemmatimonadota bacterium]
MRHVVIGIAGGSGAGKSTVAQNVLALLHAESATLVEQDAYYRDLSALPPHERELVNFDHPDSLDNELLAQHLRALKRGEAVPRPVYDFTTHTRARSPVWLEPRRIILVEGILILGLAELREVMDLKIFVDTDADLRLIRRTRRDMQERGRSLDSVLEQYERTVRPMHIEFVEPSKRWADVIVPEGGFNETAVEMLAFTIRRLLDERGPVAASGREAR